MEGPAAKLFGASIVLLAGYVFLKTSYLRRITTEHLRTDRYALHLLGISLALYVAGDLAAALLPDWTPTILASVRRDAASSGLTPPVINSIMLGAVLGLIENIWVRIKTRSDPAMLNSADLAWHRKFRLAAVIRFVRKCSDEKMRTLFRALMLRKLIMVTLKSGKVYVGNPSWPEFDPSYHLASLKLIQFASGSRDKDSKKVSLTTGYNKLTQALKPVPQNTDRRLLSATNPLRTDPFLLPAGGGNVQIDIEDFGVVIAWSEVETFSIFDENIYAWFQTQLPAP